MRWIVEKVGMVMERDGLDRDADVSWRWWRVRDEVRGKAGSG